MAALVSSGLPTDGFVFAGFPPSKAAARRTWFESLEANGARSCSSSPPPRQETLEAALDTLGDREASLGRELTKLHEEVIRGSLSAIVGRLGEPRGESRRGRRQADVPLFKNRKLMTLNYLKSWSFNQERLGRREAISELAKRHRLRSRDVFAALDRAAVLDPFGVIQRAPPIPGLWCGSFRSPRRRLRPACSTPGARPTQPESRG